MTAPTPPPVAFYLRIHIVFIPGGGPSHPSLHQDRPRRPRMSPPASPYSSISWDGPLPRFFTSVILAPSPAVFCRRTQLVHLPGEAYSTPLTSVRTRPFRSSLTGAPSWCIFPGRGPCNASLPRQCPRRLRSSPGRVLYKASQHRHVPVVYGTRRRDRCALLPTQRLRRIQSTGLKLS